MFLTRKDSLDTEFKIFTVPQSLDLSAIENNVLRINVEDITIQTTAESQ